MNLQQAVKMAMQSILHRKVRSVLTMLGIIIGIASVMIIVSVVNGYNQKSLEYYQSMGTNKVTVSATRNDGQSVYPQLRDFCASLGDQVKGITPNTSCDATVIYGTKNTANMDYPPSMYLGSEQYSSCYNFQIERGRDISRLDIDEYKQVCVLGSKAASILFDYQNPVGQTIQVNGVPFDVVGTYKEKDPGEEWSLDNMILFPYTTSRVLGQGDGQANGGEYAVRAKDAATVKILISRLNGYLSAILPPDQGDYYVYSENEWMDDQNQVAMMMSLVLGGIAFISLLVGGIGIMNIMLVTVTERTREIGIRRAIGAQRKSIVAQFLIEAAMLCGIGGLVGIAIGVAGTFIAGKLLIKMTLLPTLPVTIGAFAFSVILGILFGMYPAVKASGLQPVAALRAE
jgi:putative ABC transport system permease protein